MTVITPGREYPFETNAHDSGVAGDLTFRIENVDDVIVIPETGDGIIEFAEGEYRKLQTVPLVEGFYSAIFKRVSSGQEAVEQFEVAGAAAAANAKTRLARMVAATEDPVLDDDTLEDLLVGAQIADAQGRLPNEAGYDPTYDLNFAAAAGWDAKAGKASSRFGFSEDNQTFNRQHVFDHCERMARRYRSGAQLVPTHPLALR